jgi:hypothetical protein
VGNYDEFIDDIKERFGDADPAHTAREKKTKKETDLYQDGLKEEILQKIYNQELPTTINRWFTTAARLDRLGERLRQRTKGKGTYFPPRTHETTKPTKPLGEYNPGTATVAIDIDSTRRFGKCKHCGGDWVVGHMCERKKAAQTAWKQRTEMR